MANTWSGIESPFFQQVFAPGFATRFAGDALYSRDGIANMPFKAGKKSTLQDGSPYFSADQVSAGKWSNPYVGPVSMGEGISSTGGSTPSPEDTASWTLKYAKEMLPLQMALQQQSAELSAGLTERQLATLEPYLSRAGWEATTRNLLASERFLRTKEQQPSNIQNIMSAKQGQIRSAQEGEAALMNAVANQQNAATQLQLAGISRRFG